MKDTSYFEDIKHQKSFTRQELLQSFRNGGFELSEASFSKKLTEMVKSGELIRAGKNVYYLPDNDVRAYSHEYSELANDVAALITEQYPLLEFSVLELVQLNDFVNHQIAHNIIFLFVESEIMEFVFDSLKEQYPGKVLINPTPTIYHQYWSDNMIVIGKLPTEAPKGHDRIWHTRLEKLLVDLVSEPLLLESISESEYPTIYEDAFARYVVDERSLFRYAKRRKVDKKVRKIICESTSITLRTTR